MPIYIANNQYAEPYVIANNQYALSDLSYCPIWAVYISIRVLTSFRQSGTYAAPGKGRARSSTEPRAPNDPGGE